MYTKGLPTVIFAYIGLFDIVNETSIAAEAAGVATPDALLASALCRDLHASGGDPAAAERVVAATERLLSEGRLTVPETNLVLRGLGRVRLPRLLLRLLSALRALSLAPDDESLECLSNALVANVDERYRARAMRDLPAPDSAAPEVVFVGRSNVGKSSLVNYIVNRRAIASTSDTPGHTKSFHFFDVNPNRTDLPRFTLVDVPGLGYAEAANGTTDSWRGLLERYLSVRESLCTVFHLVDARHKLTPTDEQMIELVGRALADRGVEGRKGFRYVVVLTKTDRARAADVDATTRVLEAAAGAGLGSVVGEGDGGLRVLRTSATARRGSEDVWRTLLDHLDDWGQ